jgi:hypothetical protein
MRRRRNLRTARLAQAAVGATVIAVPTSAAALTEAPAGGQPSAAAGQGPGLAAKPRARRIRYGAEVVMTGRASVADAGRTVILQFSTAAGAGWRSLAQGVVAADGSFRLAAPLRRSGAVRVLGDWPAGAAQPAVLAAGGTTAADASAPYPVTVKAALRVPERTLEAFGSERLSVRGRLLPAGLVGRPVKLQALQADGWRVIASARTGAGGRFRITFTTAAVGRERLRVAFGGDRVNGPARQAVGTVIAFTAGVASWYDDGGATACGFHAYYGVANLTLPCGAQVTFSYHGRTVTATVDDRGPYVGGRRWDLNQHTAAALAFDGVDTVWSSA